MGHPHNVTGTCMCFNFTMPKECVYEIFQLFRMLYHTEKCLKRRTGFDVIIFPLASGFIAQADRALQELSNGVNSISLAPLEAKLEPFKVLSFFLFWSFFL